MISGLAPRSDAPMNAAGSSIDGKSCCFNDGIAKSPKPVITTAIRATRVRLARLSRVRTDMGAPPVKVRPALIVCLIRTNRFPPGPAGTVCPRMDADRPSARHREGLAVAGNEQLIADIMGAQLKLQTLFGYDRSDPLFSSHLTLSQLKILMLLSRHGAVSGGELAGMLGVGLAALSGMIDRLVVQDLVTRTEDVHDRRGRRIGLTRAGHELIDGIITAGVTKQRELLSRLTAEELVVVSQASALLVRE